MISNSNPEMLNEISTGIDSKYLLGDNTTRMNRKVSWSVNHVDQNTCVSCASAILMTDVVRPTCGDHISP